MEDQSGGTAAPAMRPAGRRGTLPCRLAASTGAAQTWPACLSKQPSGLDRLGHGQASDRGNQEASWTWAPGTALVPEKSKTAGRLGASSSRSRRARAPKAWLPVPRSVSHSGVQPPTAGARKPKDPTPKQRNHGADPEPIDRIPFLPSRFGLLPFAFRIPVQCGGTRGFG